MRRMRPGGGVLHVAFDDCLEALERVKLEYKRSCCREIPSAPRSQTAGSSGPVSTQQDGQGSSLGRVQITGRAFAKSIRVICLWVSDAWMVKLLCVISPGT